MPVKSSILRHISSYVHRYSHLSTLDYTGIEHVIQWATRDLAFLNSIPPTLRLFVFRIQNIIQYGLYM